jgi:hypothetical protein
MLGQLENLGPGDEERSRVAGRSAPSSPRRFVITVNVVENTETAVVPELVS